ncbi:glycosyl hydrolase family 92-domain-containing protein [Geopyxis carbonaria]|nr:glycosyl hydrolase family 92-domain-containing protein [Geopyxis carbonaria]
MKRTSSHDGTGIYLTIFLMVMSGLSFLVCAVLYNYGVTVVLARPADYVRPFMGSEGGGNMFPGVTRPFGSVKMGIDLATYGGSGDPYSGYLPAGNVTGFSMMHESGTGGAPKYGVVSQLPIVGTVTNPLLKYDLPRADGAKDEAMVGYYKANLSNNVQVEMSASRHAGIMRHTFPQSGEEKNILVDVSHFLPSNRGLGIEQHYVGGAINLREDGRYTGYGIYNGGWNMGVNWKIHFCGEFDVNPSKAVTFIGTGETLEDIGKNSTEAMTKRVGALFTFQGGNGTISSRIRRRQQAGLLVESKIGVSWMSEEKACEFIDEEIPEEDAFNTLINETKDAWEEELLTKISTTETDTNKLSLLYSTIYGMFIIPSDRTGENPGWESDEPYYDDIFTLWDCYRSHTPLFHILSPSRYSDFIRSMIDIWRHDGWLPDGRSSNFNGRIQGGTNADNVLADAFVKGVPSIDWDDAWSAVLNDAENEPPNNNDPQAPDSSTKEGRGAISDWKAYGHITTKFSRSVSRASEYSSNDFAIAQLAKGLNKPAAIYEKYVNRSHNWENHWDNRSTVYGFSGFLSPITPSHSFPASAWDPLDCSGCYWDNPYYQGMPYEYSFNAHHDMSRLIKRMGGDTTFIARLSKMFEPNSNPNGDTRFGKTIFNPGNEPSFASPYLFNFVPGNQWRSVAASRHIARSYYSTAANGLPGNSDAGAMQSWLLWSMLGLYPITGTTTFLIASPQLADFAIDLGGGKTFSVTTTGGNEEAGEWFVQSLRVNGEAWNKSWVEWADVFENGGTMEYVLGAEKTQWDADGERPLWEII